jgi:hypothetical protein
MEVMQQMAVRRQAAKTGTHGWHLGVARPSRFEYTLSVEGLNGSGCKQPLEVATKQSEKENAAKPRSGNQPT